MPYGNYLTGKIKITVRRKRTVKEKVNWSDSQAENMPIARKQQFLKRKSEAKND